jgi:hypothetical protein
LPSSDPARRFRDIADNIDAIAESTTGLTKHQFLRRPRNSPRLTIC